MWCLKRFYEGPKGLHKTFSGTTKKRENKNLKVNFLSSSRIGTRRVNDFSRCSCLIYCSKCESVYLWQHRQKQRCIYDPVKHLWWSFFAKTVKNTMSYIKLKKCTSILNSRCVNVFCICFWVLSLIYLYLSYLGYRVLACEARESCSGTPPRFNHFLSRTYLQHTRSIYRVMAAWCSSWKLV